MQELQNYEIIDAHVHFWDLNHLYYSWLTDQYISDHVIGNYKPLCEKNYLPEDFISETAQHKVTKCVHIQAALGHDDPVDETKWLQECAKKTGFPQTIIGHADLDSDDIEDVIARHMEFANFRGIRMFSTPEQWNDIQFQQGFKILQQNNLVFDLDADPDTMHAAAKLACQFSECQIILGHAGFPKQRSDEYFSSWRKAMMEIASCDNVACKVSGLGMCDHNWTIESIRPWVESCIEIFGINRCMFATNWPVDSLFSDYATVLNSYKEILRSFAPSEQQKFFYDNANEIYHV